jgi:hypothetical protein
MAPKTMTKAPWHLWLIGVLGLLWNGFGVYDYLMTVTRGEAYLRGMGMTDPQIAYFNAMPSWMTGVWAVGVWGALLGTVLLLLRSRWAVPAFRASIAALIISLLYTYVLSDGARVMGSQVVVMNAVVTAAAALFLWYASVMRRRGLLR